METNKTAGLEMTANLGVPELDNYLQMPRNNSKMNNSKIAAKNARRQVLNAANAPPKTLNNFNTGDNINIVAEDNSSAGVTRKAASRGN